jgi:hypothetical protein
LAFGGTSLFYPSPQTRARPSPAAGDASPPEAQALKIFEGKRHGNQGFRFHVQEYQPGATAHGWWNNASEVYRLNAWPKVAPGVAASAEITKISRSHGSPSERELHFDVKIGATATIRRGLPGTGLRDMLDSVRAELQGSCCRRRHGHHAGDQGVGRIDLGRWKQRRGGRTAITGTRIGHKAMTATLLAVLAQKESSAGMTVVGRSRMGSNDERQFGDASFERLMAHRSGILNVT